MNRSMSAALATTEGNELTVDCRRPLATATRCNSVALDCLNVEIDRYGVHHKALADECGKSKETFSKMRGGTQAFGLDDFEKLPHALQVAWLKRYAQVIGVKVVELEPGELSERLLMLVDELATVAKLARVVTRGQVKAKLPVDR